MIYFATSNSGKFSEVKKFLDKKGITINHLKVSLEEPRGDIRDIAIYSSKEAYSIIKKPVFVEDAGLFIPSLNGFPGEFSSWTISKIGIKGILKLMEDFEGEDRIAYFRSVIAFNTGNDIHTFEGRVYGHIIKDEKGIAESSLPYDSIFVPKGYLKTFAEDYELKSKLSHRIKALSKFYEFLENKYLKSNLST